MKSFSWYRRTATQFQSGNQNLLATSPSFPRISKHTTYWPLCELERLHPAMYIINENNLALDCISIASRPRIKTSVEMLFRNYI